MALPVKFDHCVVHVSDWERSNAFYRDVLGAELVGGRRAGPTASATTQLNLHGPGVAPAEVARLPVQPGNSDLCFEWNGPIADAVAHLARCGVPIQPGRWSASAQRARAPASISATRTARCSNSSPITQRRRPLMTTAHDPTVLPAEHSGAAGRRRRAPPRRPQAAGVRLRRPNGRRSICRSSPAARWSTSIRAPACPDSAARRLGCDPGRARLHAAIVLVPRPFRRAQAARRRAPVRPLDAGHRLSARGGRAPASAVPGPVRCRAQARRARSSCRPSRSPA